ncbi:MAG: serine--tRNA ligase [candidate division NC10 bacterium RIFCSPLOWO2_12_FULL_66_18]|nr:MAG: serine--tRNA ligase [candidate division NC10 bacterium RIFCSPLOWO2_02_FULL_66_22]OGC00871.1 MAG: serine--tRNA ligase [candidate division NC10 bacterium RIFCSPLOWO2_12_FULL_66_18]
MLDARFVREHVETVEKGLRDRGVTLDLQEFLAADAARRRLLSEVEQLKHRRNTVSEEVGQRKRQGRDAGELITEMRELGDRIKKLDEEVRRGDERIETFLLGVPNLPHPSVPVGRDSSANVEVRRWGEPRRFDFPAKPHWEIGEALGLLNFERAARMSQARFAVLIGLGARLERALINFMLDLHTKVHGYTEVYPPLLVNAAAMTGTGQLPKFADELFKTADESLYMIPTAEVPVTNLHREETLPPGTLPLSYVAFTPCFRREAGSYGKDTRGLIRQHQFNKVELVKFAEADRSHEALEQMTRDAEAVLQRLGIPYRVVALCTGDLGFAAAKTYDIEVWLPSQGAYREISSISNCEAFQARRANIRYRPAPQAPVEYAHTLNGSGLAVGRTWLAILENYQEPDGSVRIPDALRPYMDGRERIGKS